MFLAVTSSGLAVFMVNRLHVLFTQRQINVKGVVYSKADQPAFYWFWVVAAIFGLSAGAGLFVLSMAVLMGSLP